jgi:hypothetical protein
MSATDELTDLYEQWRHLTLEEGHAIESHSWQQVEHYQAAKIRLQPRIIEVSQRLDVTVHEGRFRPMVEELMKLECSNVAKLRGQRCSAETQKLELDKSSRNLRQLHKSYVPPARANWQSYS